MSVTTTTNRVLYTADGTNVIFAFPYKFFADTDLRVYVDGVLQTLTTHYTVSTIAGDFANGGNVVFGVAPTIGKIVTIARGIPYTQQTDYQDYAEFPANVFESDLDRRAIAEQQLADSVSRVLQIPETDPVGLDMTLPAQATRASTFFAFDASGKPIPAAGMTSVPVSTFMATLLDDTTAAAGRTTLDVYSKDEADSISLVAGEALSARDPVGFAYGKAYKAKYSTLVTQDMFTSGSGHTYIQICRVPGYETKNTFCLIGANGGTTLAEALIGHFQYGDASIQSDVTWTQVQASTAGIEPSWVAPLSEIGTVIFAYRNSASDAAVRIGIYDGSTTLTLRTEEVVAAGTASYVTVVGFGSNKFMVVWEETATGFLWIRPGTYNPAGTGSYITWDSAAAAIFSTAMSYPSVTHIGTIGSNQYFAVLCRIDGTTFARIVIFVWDTSSLTFLVDDYPYGVASLTTAGFMSRECPLFMIPMATQNGNIAIGSFSVDGSYYKTLRHDMLTGLSGTYMNAEAFHSGQFIVWGCSDGGNYTRLGIASPGTQISQLIPIQSLAAVASRYPRICNFNNGHGAIAWRVDSNSHVYMSMFRFPAFQGFAKSAISKDASGAIQFQGRLAGFSGLRAGESYGLDYSSAAIGLWPGRPIVGRALSDTVLLIGAGIDRPAAFFE